MLLGLRFRWLAAALLAAVLSAFVACSGSGSSTGIPPITGIVIRAETLTTGRGCGTGPNQLFKYAAIVYGYTDGPVDVKGSYNTAVTAGVYDCFADGTFVELPETNGSTTFRLEVFAYSEPAYTAAKATIESAGTNGQTFRSTNPTWTTICTATQLRDVQALAVCDPLSSGVAPSTILLRTGAFPRNDGRISVCANNPADGGVDAGDAGDAGDAADAADAGEDAEAGAGDGGTGSGNTYLTVRAKARANGADVQSSDVACPDVFTIANAAPNVTYEIAVDLLDGANASIGTTTCTAQAVIGTEVAATCQPVK